MTSTPRLLVLRKDNIGDLICTTPMLRLLRQQFPAARIDALVTHYNAEVLARNPDLNAVFAYQKAKHRSPGESLIALYWARMRQLIALRKARLDAVILPAEGAQASAHRMARWLAPRRIVSARDFPVPAGSHEVERCVGLLQAFGIDCARTDIPPCTLIADPQLHADAHNRLRDYANQTVVGLHISSRKVPQRWPVERFVGLIARAHQAYPALKFALFWSPGAADNPLHPGDDEKARQIMAECAHLGLSAFPTRSLKELIGGLSAVDMLLCSDGGHMHVAAALGKPIVCLFGNSDAQRWHPWGVPYRLLQKDSQEVADIAIDEVFTALETFISKR